MQKPNEQLPQVEMGRQSWMQEQEALRSQASKNQDMIRGAALNTRVTSDAESALKNEQLAAMEKDKQKEQVSYFLSTTPKPKPENSYKDETADPKKSSFKPVPSSAKVEVAYFAANVKMPDYAQDLGKFAAKAGLKLTPKELKGLAEQAHKLNDFIARMYQGKDAPSVKMGVINGEIGLIVEGTKDQIKAIAKELGIGLESVNKKAITAEANFSATPPTVTANPSPMPKPVAKPAKQEEENQSSYTTPTPFSTRPSPYK